MISFASFCLYAKEMPWYTENVSTPVMESIYITFALSFAALFFSNVLLSFLESFYEILSDFWTSANPFS